MRSHEKRKNKAESLNKHISTRAVSFALAVLMITLAIAQFIAAPAFAEPEKVKDAKYFLLNDPGYLDFFSGNQIRSLEFGTEGDVGFARIHLVPMGVDPFIFMPISLITDGISCDEYRYVAISVRSPYPSRCNLYFGTSIEGGLDEAKNIPSLNSITDSDDWDTVVFYCGGNAKWTGILGTARFDPYGGVPEGMDYIDIRWMAFVKEEKDLEDLDVSLDDLSGAGQYTRMPVYSTPDRTKPPENSFKPDVTSQIVPVNTESKSGISPVVLIIVSSILTLCIIASAVGIIVIKRKDKNGKT